MPHFVIWVDEDGKTPLERGNGTPDFRFVYPGVAEECWREGRCWVCGSKINSRWRAFCAGPMCGVNGTSAEPPSHRECARFSAIACPFLVRPHAKRRPVDAEQAEEPPGIMLHRNPGVAMLWITANPGIRVLPNGTLWSLGTPAAVSFYREGREATREEIEESVRTGLPALQKIADEQEGASEELAAAVERFRKLLPE